jgi:hypothetical protein
MRQNQSRGNETQSKEEEEETPLSSNLFLIPRTLGLFYESWGHETKLKSRKWNRIRRGRRKKKTKTLLASGLSYWENKSFKSNCKGENWEQHRKTIGRKRGREHASREILCMSLRCKELIFLFFHKSWILPWSGGKHVLQFCCNRCCNAHVLQCLLLVSFEKTVQKVGR